MSDRITAGLKRSLCQSRNIFRSNSGNVRPDYCEEKTQHPPSSETSRTEEQRIEHSDCLKEEQQPTFQGRSLSTLCPPLFLGAFYSYGEFPVKYSME